MTQGRRHIGHDHQESVQYLFSIVPRCCSPSIDSMIIRRSQTLQNIKQTLKLTQRCVDFFVSVCGLVQQEKVCGKENSCTSSMQLKTPKILISNIYCFNSHIIGTCKHHYLAEGYLGIFWLAQKNKKTTPMHYGSINSIKDLKYLKM